MAVSTITLVPGWSALTLTIRGANLEMGSAAAVPLFVLGGFLPGKWYYWAAFVGGVALSMLAVGFTWTMKSFRRSRQEVQAGYATIPKVASEQADLFYLTAKTHEVISGPHEPRPRTGRRRDVAEHMARRGKKTPS